MNLPWSAALFPSSADRSVGQLLKEMDEITERQQAIIAEEKDVKLMSDYRSPRSPRSPGNGCCCYGHHSGLFLGGGIIWLFCFYLWINWMIKSFLFFTCLSVHSWGGVFCFFWFLCSLIYSLISWFIPSKISHDLVQVRDFIELKLKNFNTRG